MVWVSTLCSCSRSMVAVTRARHSLLVSGSYWSTQTRPRGPGLFLLELQSAGLLAEDAFPELDETDENPYALATQTIAWPLDPLGIRRPRVVHAAQAVRDARERVLDWWASAIDRDSRTRAEIDRQAPYQRVRDRMLQEIAVRPGSTAASYWLAAAARGQGDWPAA